MNAHALGILEYSRLLAHVAGHASSAPGAAAVRALVPRTDREWIEAEHARVAALRSLILSELGWPTESIPDLGEALKRLRIPGLTWTAHELLQGATLLRSSRRTREALRDPRRPAITMAYLTSYAAQLVDLRAREDAIERAIADDGTVRDDASPTLRRARRELRQAEGELVRLLEREMGKLESHHQVSDLSVTMRNGRWVMPMRREARGYVGGIVHDSSGTGATIFVEPPAAVEFGNRVRELELEEQREVEKVLRELTEELHPYHEAMLQAWQALVALDALYARARYSLNANCAPLEFAAPADGLRIVNGRHPLLLATGVPVVAFDLTMERDERTLLVSGPNTGGKTVLLKAIGLLCMMAQAGVPAPVGSNSCLPVFDDVFADVGDEQSIEASLSTFSAHLKNLGEILQSATPSSLVLVDELGSGTDPSEGAALGGAILETLTARGTLTLATTHLGQLKLLATEVAGVVNASLQFDAVQLAPTYRLLKGVPGRSYGLSIARRLQLPEAVIQRAEERLPQGERDLAVLLADVEAREEVLTDREQQLEREQERTRSRMAAVADRELKVREREREAERSARKQARQFLLEARTQLEDAIAAVKSAAQASTTTSAGNTLDDAARAARRTIEQEAARQGQEALVVEQRGERDRAKAQRRQGGPAATTATAAAPRPISEGDNVLVGTLGDKIGRVVSVRGQDARVLVGSLTLTVPLRQLTHSKAAPPPMVKIALSGDIAEVEPVREVDVRGLRIDEVDDQVLQALDAAVRNDLRELRIIHGKGTGALRLRVGEMLKKDTRVTGYRLGAWNEGGAGVTVAELS
jgi:DNA mismatch repair protein MutS2